MGPPSPDRHVNYAVTILVIAAVTLVAVNIKPIPLAAEVKITVDPPGAEIWVDGKFEGAGPLQVYVNPGQHRFESRMQGYEPSAPVMQNFEDGGSGFVRMKLTAIPPVLQVVSNLDSGTVHLDGGRTELIPREGSLSLRMPVNTRSVEVTSGNVRVVAPIEMKPAMRPEVNGEVLAANAGATAISYGGGKTRAGASRGPVELFVDGRTAGSLGPEAREIPELTQGPHRIRLVEGANVFDRPVTIGDIPGVLLLVTAEQNVGNLNVRVNLDGARILIDGAEFRSSSTAGDNFIANLRVRLLQVSVVMDGYPAPEPRSVFLRKGETVTVEFKLEKEAPPSTEAKPQP
jgi:hypothetical protein